MTNPDIVTERHGVRSPPLKEFVIVFRTQVIGSRAIAEVMLGGTPCGMVAGIDPHVTGNRTELADRGIGGGGVIDDVAVGPHGDFGKVGARANTGPRAKDRIVDLAIGVNSRKGTFIRPCQARVHIAVKIEVAGLKLSVREA